MFGLRCANIAGHWTSCPCTLQSRASIAARSVQLTFAGFDGNGNEIGCVCGGLNGTYDLAWIDADDPNQCAWTYSETVSITCGDDPAELQVRASFFISYDCVGYQTILLANITDFDTVVPGATFQLVIPGRIVANAATITALDLPFVGGGFYYCTPGGLLTCTASVTP